MTKSFVFQCSILAIILAAATTTVTSDDAAVIPSSEVGVNSWFQANVKPLSVRKGTLNSSLEAAETNPRTIRVRKDGKGDFTTVNDAISSIPTGNTQRVIVDIGPGKYREKITIPREKPFITFKGKSGNKPTLTFDGTSKEYGTVYSATLQVEADFFVASNVIIENSAPRPDGKRVGAQAVAFRIAGDKSAFYNCRFLGFQDTLCDDKGRHFFKDCYIQGTVDFIWGNAKSLYLGTEIHVLADQGPAVITAQAKANMAQDAGFSFLHCSITGVGKGAFLGRAWMEMPTVIFSLSKMGDVVNSIGWSDNNHPDRDSKFLFAEYNNEGPGANQTGRAKFTKILTADEAKPYISLGYIHGSNWLLPPP